MLIRLITHDSIPMNANKNTSIADLFHVISGSSHSLLISAMHSPSLVERKYPFIMLPEAVAIVMAPTDTSSPHGIFHLSDPGGVSVIRNCQQRGFHPHEEPSDGTSLYEHCSHVFMNANLRFDVVDLR
ncbi:hypothetical protein Pint_24398 [Pistacia integerrima]|uniref:Uncharacterized protein n=1 Tax=Pistacia integerrima TaxID=434235 RepID=A0ACC0YGB1_9ROSI|nr:hypothetical protein Pint_24398 [Pistacia integerrima]